LEFRAALSLERRPQRETNYLSDSDGHPARYWPLGVDGVEKGLVIVGKL